MRLEPDREQMEETRYSLLVTGTPVRLAVYSAYRAGDFVFLSSRAVEKGAIINRRERGEQKTRSLCVWPPLCARLDELTL
jgi:hypothetical protein